MYYQAENEYRPKSKARGEDVRGDFEAVAEAFKRLPPHNELATGFDESFIVQPVVGDYSPIPFQLWKTWSVDVEASGHNLLGLYDFAEETAEAKAALVSGNPYTVVRIGDSTEVASVGYTNYQCRFARPRVDPKDSIVVVYTARADEAVIDSRRRFNECSVYINGAYQTPGEAYSTTEQRFIHLTAPLEEGDQVVMLMGRCAPSDAPDRARTQPFSITISNPTGLFPNYPLANLKLPDSIEFPAGMPGATAICLEPASKLLVINIFHNDTEVGLISFAPGALTGTITWLNSVSVSPGDRLRVISHSEVEPDIRGLGITLTGKRTI